MTKKKTRTKVIGKKPNSYEKVTDAIVESLQLGDIPWNSPYIRRYPQNFTKGNIYRGINYFLLGMDDALYQSYATFNQIKNNGGKVNKGAKSRLVYFFKMLEIETKQKLKSTGETIKKDIPFLRTYNVFKLEDTNLDPSLFIEIGDAANEDKKEVHQKIDIALELFFTNTTLTQKLGGKCGTYSPMSDCVRIPDTTNYKNLDSRYSTIFHELVHATGHESRLNRDLKGFDIDKHSYSLEELVAEMGAAILCTHFGIASEKLIENKKAYCQSWAKYLNSDTKLAYKAASKAQKAVDFILERMNELETTKKAA